MSRYGDVRWSVTTSYLQVLGKLEDNLGYDWPASYPGGP